jgi:hypothetical protein
METSVIDFRPKIFETRLLVCGKARGVPFLGWLRADFGMALGHGAEDHEAFNAYRQIDDGADGICR